MLIEGRSAQDWVQKEKGEDVGVYRGSTGLLILGNKGCNP